MNSLDLNFDNRLETDPNNELWYSSTYLPISHYQYIDNTNSQKLLGIYH